MKSILFSLALIALCAVGQGVHQYASTIRPPAFPLAVRTPYSNYWLADNVLPGNWASFWEGQQTTGWAGIVRVDGQAYNFMGDITGHTGLIQVAIQRASYITPTQTIFNITAGEIELSVTFLSPVEYNDIERQTIPLSYVFITAKSRDGREHKVELYMDISAEWATVEKTQLAKWDINTAVNGMKIWTTEMQNPIKFAEYRDYAQWGQAVHVTSAGASHQSGDGDTVRRQFIVNGRLQDFNDNNYRCVECGWPVMGFAHDLGQVSGTSNELEFVVGHIREENINLMDQPQKALWTYYFNDQNDMIRFFFNDVAHAKQVAEEVDNRLLNEAYAIGGQDYADIIALSLRQAIAGTEFSGNRTHPLLYQKEISSNGNMQTVDVMYPAVPMHYYMNVKFMQYLLEPLFYQMENGFWPKDYSMHDIGFHYPNATGHLDGVQEDMPVEESANMILMVANIVFHPDYDRNEARTYIQSHYQVLSGWAEYLYHNCLYPVDQLTTDDFIGPTQLNSGLALKGILGLKAFARISEIIGETNATEFYDRTVAEYIPIWFEESLHHSGTHLKMEYNVTEGYQFKYNAYHDKLLNLSAVPQQVYEIESAWYLQKEESYGVPFVSTHDYTKSDWEMWTAAAFGDASPTLKSHIIENMAKYLRDTSTRVPFSDWYNTANARSWGFKARPVAGGHFSLLALELSRRGK